MKTRVLGILVLVLVLAMAGSVAAAGGVVASVVPSNAMPRVGQQITVAVRMDATNVELGSFSSTLTWNPAVLKYVGHSGIQAGFTGVVNATQVGAGKLIFNGVKITGATGKNDVLSVTFVPVKASYTVLDLSITAMAAARTYIKLTPVVRDGNVWVRR